MMKGGTLTSFRMRADTVMGERMNRPRMETAEIMAEVGVASATESRTLRDTDMRHPRS